ncbi:DUF410-domain-containing protein [Fistulina hepatica ATCC 64428]|nr:DUF410-domain-containing protein [Fistulina hepatica ATCC 64428]
MVSPSSSRALNAILPKISEAPYEAHQKARTFASRYVKSGQYDTAIDVLFQSAASLFKAGQTGSGIDLATFLLDVYETKNEAVTEESRGRLTQLIALAGPEGTWRKTVIDKAVAWSCKHGPYPAGDPDLQHYIGELLFKESDFEGAESHFLASGSHDSAHMLAEMYIQWLCAGGEPGAFALRGIIPFLFDGNILAARSFIMRFVSLLPRNLLSSSPPIQAGAASEVVVTKDSVVNFAQMAVLTCQRANGEQNKLMRESWVRLCGTYQSKVGLLAAPPVRKALNEIGSLYFALPQPRNQATNPLGDMLSSMFGGSPQGQSAPRRLLAPTTSAGLD